MSVIGAIAGDIIGSRFEWNNIKTKEFELFTPECKFTDDSVMTLAIAKALLKAKENYDHLENLAVTCMQEIGRHYPNCGYGAAFGRWMFSNNPQPYNSFGNGAAMRVSPCGFAAQNLDEAKLLSKKVTEVTHNHPDGIKGAEATAVCIFLARTGSSISAIRDYVNKHYYPMNFTLDGIRDSYRFNETCQDTVPQAIMAFLESTGFEDAIRNAISIGGDSDTLAAITGGIAEAAYGVPEEIKKQAVSKLDKTLRSVWQHWEKNYPYTPPLVFGYELLFPFINYFDQRPQMEWLKGSKSEDGVYTLPMCLHSKELQDFLHVFYKTNAYDKHYLRTLERYDDYEDIGIKEAIRTGNVEFLLALLTAVIRKDRFCEGALDSAIQSGVFADILKRLRELHEENAINKRNY